MYLKPYKVVATNSEVIIILEALISNDSILNKAGEIS